MPNANIIGERLRKLRGDRDRAVVADAVGISTSALSMYEIGQRVPRDEIKMKLASYYGKTVEDIFYAPDGHEM